LTSSGAAAAHARSTECAPVVSTACAAGDLAIANAVAAASEVSASIATRATHTAWTARATRTAAIAGATYSASATHSAAIASATYSSGATHSASATYASGTTHATATARTTRVPIPEVARLLLTAYVLPGAGLTVLQSVAASRAAIFIGEASVRIRSASTVLRVVLPTAVSAGRLL